jgi:hypothetical protein
MPRLVLLITATLLCASLHAASPNADQIFPDSTKGFLAFRNLKDFGEQWKKTQFGQLLDDPLMQDFKKEVQKQLTDRMENTFGLTLDGISSLPSGEVAFGMIAITNQTPGYVLTLDVAGKRSETDNYLTNLTQKLVGAGVKKSTETYKGQQITILTFPPPAKPAAFGNAKIDNPLPPIERKAHYMFLQDVLIASDQLYLLKLIADRVADQSGKSLADVEGYQVVMKRCIGDMPAGVFPAIRWYIEPLDYGESVRVLLRGSVAQNRREKPSIFSILKQQGFDAVRGIGGVISVKTEAQESVYRTFIYAQKPYRLAMRMFNFPESTNFTPPNWMPDDLARCTMAYVDPSAIFDNVGVLFDALMGDEGMWKGILDGLEKDPYGPKINIREELVANLGTRVLGMSQYEKPITIKSESLVIAVELKEGREENMRAGVEKLFGTDEEMEFMLYKSYKIWHRKPLEDIVAPIIEIDIPDIFSDESRVVSMIPVKLAADEGEDDDRPPAFPDGGVVVAKGCLLVSTNRDYLKVILDRLDAPGGASIKDSAEYKEVDAIFAGLGLTSKPHFFQFFARTQETMLPTYEMIRKNQMAQSQAVLAKLLNEVLTPEGESGRRQIFDGSSLPSFDRVQKYFGKVGVYGVSEENGYFIKGFAVE